VTPEFSSPTRYAARVMSRRSRLAFHAGAIAAAAIGVVCLGANRRAMSGTFDEANHVAAGLEWWQLGTYTMWTENPPLPRLAAAALPYLRGMRLPPREAWDPKTHEWDRSWEIGTDLLYAGDGFDRNLARARLATLPFFLLALAAAWGLAGGARRPAAGFLAVALTATLPALIAHGALATTDVAFVGTFLLAVLALWRWAESPTVGRALALGAALGLALLCKFSVLAFFPAAVLALAAARRLAGVPARPTRPAPEGPDARPLAWRAIAGHAGAAFLVGALVTWAGYRFSIGRIDDLPLDVKDWIQILPPPAARSRVTAWLLHARLPMPELYHGVRFLMGHDRVGADAYLFGKLSGRGFLGFYPIALLVKTPLPFLALLVAAAPYAWRHRREREGWAAPAAALAALGILLVSLRSHVNIGSRHVFVIVPLAAVAIARAADGALAAADGRRRTLAAAVLGALVAAQTGIAIAAGTRALGYFNALAGAEPGKVLLDSDLDWGQDLYALRREAAARGIQSLSIGFFGTVRQCQHGLPHLEALRPGRPTTGWIAISENYYQPWGSFMLLRDPCDPTSRYREHEVPPRPFAWLQAYTPVAIAGTSVRLYYIEPPAVARP
jgi:4-amino-4-deoxy-L-arabinose transferase-like glycosyltransferase